VIYGSVCSGIEAASVAWHPLGWRPAFFSEIAPFPRAVLKHHCPNVPLHEDFTTISGDEYEPIQLLVGGTPCQSFSIAGLRGGLDDDRGNLALEFLRLADRTRPRWVVWENVPGVLSSNDGRDFGSILGGLGELGYGWSYRVLDAQYIRVDSHPWAVPQRRRRVFVVGYLGDWRRAAAVLFERESLQGHPPPRREAGKAVAPTISARPTGGGGLGTDFDIDGGLVSHALKGEGFDASEDGAGRGTPIVPVANSGAVSHCITASAQQSLDAETETLIAFNSREDPEVTGDRTGPLGSSSPQAQAVAIQERAASENPSAGPDGKGWSADGAAYTIEARNNVQSVALPYAVRRLTPTECERLQGFPDGYTQVPYRNKPAADGPRYKALGNSMAVNCMNWIGQRIAIVDAL